MKYLFLFLAVATLTACNKNKTFHKAIQGNYEVRYVDHHAGEAYDLAVPSGEPLWTFDITETHLNGWHWHNSEYEVLDEGVLFSTDAQGVQGEVNVDFVGDSLRVTDHYGNVLHLGIR